MRVRERCACGAETEIEADSILTGMVRAWREEHTCDRRPPPRDTTTDAYVDKAPHDHPPLGFRPP